MMEKSAELQKIVNEKKKITYENVFLKKQLAKKDRQINELFADISALSGEMREVCFQLLSTISTAMEMRDGYAKEFSEKTALYATKIAKAIGLSSIQIDLVRRAGYLLEIGRLGLREDIFQKMEKMTKEEYEMVKTHPKLAEDILKPIKFLEEIIPIVRHHHERYDGQGYPDGLSGKQIPVESRILSVASAYVAMIQQRPHRKALSKKQAKIELRAGSNSQFDPKIVKAFVKITEEESK
jgi:HD-GYP domain-containing protein (c-di-GMP phosphodiesterase class II)